MSDREKDYTGIKEKVKVRAKEIELEYRDKAPPVNWEPETEHPDIEKVFCYVWAMLESYRAAPENSQLRKDIDNAMKIHRKLARSAPDKMAKPRHNLLVLEYIIEKRLSHNEIQRQLGIGSGTFQRHREKGIRELARICTNDFRLIPHGLAWHD